MSVTLRRVCGCMGCQEPAVGIAEHPEHGRRAVCEEHAEGLLVIDDV